MNQRLDILTRASAGLTHEALAARLGLAQSTVTMMLNRKRNITDATLLNIARSFPHLAQEVADLLGYKTLIAAQEDCHAKPAAG